MKGLVSVIVPVYNVEKYVRRCVHSILAQTYSKLEVLLIDDGSQDQSGMICEEYPIKDSRVRVIHQENGGLSSARNTGIEEAKGEYLAFVDSDDFIAKNFVERLLKACKETGSEIAQCRWECVTGDSLTKQSQLEETSRVYSGYETLEQMYEADGAYYIVAWNKLYFAKLFADIRYPIGRIHEDEATTYRLLEKAEKVVVLDTSLYGYFTSDASITRNQFKLQRLDWEIAVRERLAYFQDKGYDSLLLPTIKAYLDGCTMLYFQCKKFVQGSENEQRELKRKMKHAYLQSNSAGGFSFRSRLGYLLFFYAPGIYRKVITQVNPEIWQE